MLLAMPPARTLALGARAYAEPAGASARRRAGAKAGRRTRAPRALPGALRDPRHLGEARRRRARRARVRSGLDREPAPRTPTAMNLIRVFRLQERLKSFGRDDAAPAAHVHVVGAGTMGGDIAAWCALRGLTVTLQDQNAERLKPAIERAAKLFGDRLKDPRRVRDALDRLIPDVAGDGVARADVIIEAIFENLEAKRKLFADAGGEGEARRAARDQHVEHSARADRDAAQGSFAPDRPALLQSGAAHDAGGDRRRREHEERSRAARRRVRAPDRQAAAAGEERAGLSRQPRARPRT